MRQLSNSLYEAIPADSQGAAETVPWVRVTNLARTIESLKQAGVWVIGTDGDAEESLYEQDLSGPCAMVLGSEGAGMRRLTRDLCDFVVKLPMAGSVSSLNVSVAAGVCLFEAVRQRVQEDHLKSGRAKSKLQCLLEMRLVPEHIKNELREEYRRDMSY